MTLLLPLKLFPGEQAGFRTKINAGSECELTKTSAPYGTQDLTKETKNLGGSHLKIGEQTDLPCYPLYCFTFK